MKFESKLYIIGEHNSEEGEFLVELNGEETVVDTKTMLTHLNNKALEISYNNDDRELLEALKCLTVKYISVETFADGGNEHDVYEHNIIFENGNVTMDKGGKFLKSYKREKSAIKFAESFGYEVKVF